MLSSFGRPALAVFTVALAGCGLGPGSSSDGTATLTVTRDYGATPMVEGSVEKPPETETVMRLLDREARIETRYGGGFVQSIEGVSGSVEGGRTFDWFFYVNGIESPIGSADRKVEGGDRIWWDHHDWTDVMRVPAVVGSFPEPFLQTSTEEEDRLPVVMHCVGSRKPCVVVRERLADEGVDVTEPDARTTESRVIRIIVGRWHMLHDPVARQLGLGPAESGVFARFVPVPAGSELLALDTGAEASERLGAGAGIVAAARDGEDPPTWIVSGVDKPGVEAAAAALTESVLRDRFAVIVAAGSDATLPIPVVEER